MKILMMTNTYKPIVGGLEKSVETFTEAFRGLGHEVFVVAPEVEERPPDEKGVIRVPAIHNVKGTEFSLKLPVPGVISEALGDWKPDIVHAHHPFLVGATALRYAYKLGVPLVFTHHTLFEQNMHYVSSTDSDALKRFIIELSTGFANLADRVFAPSGSLSALIAERGVKTPIEVVPTGIDVKRFERGDGAAVRRKAGISENAFVVGHVGRLAPEKNLEFLARSIAPFLKAHRSAHFLYAGKGPSEEAMAKLFSKAGVCARVHSLGVVQGQDLVNAYHAMDTFAFASQSETQGMVLTEAMAAGLPVVAVDACGVRDVVIDGVNGRLLPIESEADFAEALAWFSGLGKRDRDSLRAEARAVAAQYTIDACVERALSAYAKLIREGRLNKEESDDNAWTKTMRLMKAEWDLMKTFTRATGAVLKNEDVSTTIL